VTTSLPIIALEALPVYIGRRQSFRFDDVRHTMKEYVPKALLIVLALSSGAAFSQRPADRSSPPVDTAGTGGFTARRLPARVGIDGRAWKLTEPDMHLGQPASFTPPGADYELRFTDPDDEGDFERWAVMLARPGRRPVSLTAGGKTTFVYVSPDARYIFMEPLIVVDTMTWQRRALYAALGIKPYVIIRAISQDRKRLFIESTSCAGDCGGRKDDEYFELTMPK
jgi:hypothetical protein